MVRTGKHRAFIVECFVKTENYVDVHGAFHLKKNELKRRDSVPSHVTMSKWVKSFRETSAVIPVGVVRRKKRYEQWSSS